MGSAPTWLLRWLLPSLSVMFSTLPLVNCPQIIIIISWMFNSTYCWIGQLLPMTENKDVEPTLSMFIIENHGQVNVKYFVLFKMC